MNNNKVCNQKVQVPTGMDFNDKDYLSCLNSSLKEMVKNYAIAMTEASNEKLYEEYKKVFILISSLQREAYQLMFMNGWYCLEKTPGQKIKQKFDMLSKEYSDME